MSESPTPDRNSLLATLRSKSVFLPDGFRDEDGVWHDGPVRAEFTKAVDALQALLIECDSAISQLHHRGSWPLDRFETDRLIGRLRREG